MPFLLCAVGLLSFLAGMVFMGWVARRVVVEDDRAIEEANRRADYFRAAAGELYAVSCGLALELQRAQARSRDLETEGEEWKNA